MTKVVTLIGWLPFVNPQVSTLEDWGWYLPFLLNNSFFVTRWMRRVLISYKHRYDKNITAVAIRVWTKVTNSLTFNLFLVFGFVSPVPSQKSFNSSPSVLFNWKVLYNVYDKSFNMDLACAGLVRRDQDKSNTNPPDLCGLSLRSFLSCSHYMSHMCHLEGLPHVSLWDPMCGVTASCPSR